LLKKPKAMTLLQEPESAQLGVAGHSADVVPCIVQPKPSASQLEPGEKAKQIMKCEKLVENGTEENKIEEKVKQGDLAMKQSESGADSVGPRSAAHVNKDKGIEFDEKARIKLKSHETLHTRDAEKESSTAIDGPQNTAHATTVNVDRPFKCSPPPPLDQFL